MSDWRGAAEVLLRLLRATEAVQGGAGFESALVAQDLGRVHRELGRRASFAGPMAARMRELHARRAELLLRGAAEALERCTGVSSSLSREARALLAEAD